MKTLKTLTTFAAGSIAAVGLFSIVGKAEAATVTFSDSFSNVATDIGDIGPPVDFGELLTLPKFDTLGGTRSLTDVRVRLTYDIDTDGTFTNNTGGTLTNVTASLSTGFYLNANTDTDTASQEVVNAMTTTGFQPDPYQRPVDGSPVTGGQFYSSIAQGASVSFNPNTPSQIAGYFNVANIAAFVASGGDTDFSVDAATLTTFSFTGGGGNLTADLETLADALIEIEYTFDETTPPTPGPSTPEPATLLGLIAFGGAGLLSRRRSK